MKQVKPIEDGILLSVAAKMLGVTVQALSYRIRSGKRRTLAAEKRGPHGDWYVSQAAIEAELKHKQETELKHKQEKQSARSSKPRRTRRKSAGDR